MISASQDDDTHARRLRLQDELRHRIERLLADPFVRRTLGMGPAGVTRSLRSRRKRPRLKPITTFHRGYVDADGGDTGDAS
ncbi:MAG TPA: hypothetical protein VLV83_00695 [Acidobacteriota bacterium]|nr:hypothetical protein [Acidobacteriota bacterium]